MRFFFNISKNEMRLQDNHHEKKKNLVILDEITR